MSYVIRRRSTLVGLLAATLVGTSASAALVPSAVAAPKAAKAAAKPSLGARALRPGASGNDVKELQKLLRQVGITVKKVDGQYGPGTVDAVKKFQTAANLLPATGTAGPKTIAALKQAVLGGAAANLQGGGYDDTIGSGKSQSLGDRIPLKQGMSGHDVKVLQDFLSRVGNKTTTDGEFGKGTTSSMQAFETKNGLDVDGVVSADDIAVLRGQVDAGADAPAAAKPLQLAPGDRATVGADGLAVAPANAPDAVKAMIAAGNEIAFKPYVYGGGHGKWEDRGYDCSGSVSYVLHAAGILDQSMPSGGFEDWGDAGPGQWVTLYANEGHIYAVIAGLRFDTSGMKDDNGTRWHASERPTSGYVVRHPTGL